MSEQFKVKLKNAVKAHGEEVDELTFRPPTVEELMEVGLPHLIIPSADGHSVGVEVRQGVVGRYISKLAAIPMSSVKAMSLHDFSACTAVVMSFFGQEDGETAKS